MKKTTYKSAGVNVKQADKFVKDISAIVKKTGAKSIGGFGALYPIDTKKYKNPVLVSSTDGVGTKLKLAFFANKHNTIGIDLVAMSVNDILVEGAKPLFFLDYTATGKLDKNKLVKVVKGIAKGCKQADCVLIGGETAEMPGMYQKGEYDLAGFCVGIVDREKILNSKNVKKGDIVIGLASTGFHSNGYSLVRKVLTKKQIKDNIKKLLAPTKIYVKPVLSVLKKVKVKSIAHITGGGFYANIPRSLPAGVSVRITKGTWPVSKIFTLVQKKGNIEEEEMFSTFNMGIGMILIVSEKDTQKVIKEMSKFKLKAYVIGKVVKGNKKVEVV